MEPDLKASYLGKKQLCMWLPLGLMYQSYARLLLLFKVCWFSPIFLPNFILLWSFCEWLDIQQTLAANHQLDKG